MQPFLIIGLGNPGRRYQDTRHNLGFITLDSFALKENRKFSRGPGPYDWLNLTLSGHEVFCIKPVTFMNRSGVAVADARLRLQVPVHRCLVLCDDLALTPGKIRLRAGGSDGGHHGLASVMNYLHSRDISRLRMGIGNPPGVDRIQYVLSRFEREEQFNVQQMITRAIEAIQYFVVNGIHETMNVVNKSN